MMQVMPRSSLAVGAGRCKIRRTLEPYDSNTKRPRSPHVVGRRYSGLAHLAIGFLLPFKDCRGDGIFGATILGVWPFDHWSLGQETKCSESKYFLHTA